MLSTRMSSAGASDPRPRVVEVASAGASSPDVRGLTAGAVKG